MIGSRVAIRIALPLAFTVACHDSRQSGSVVAFAGCETPPPTIAVSALHSLALDSSGVAQVTAISADGAGGLWVLDQSAPTVVHFDSNGRPGARITATGGAPWELKAPQAIAADNEGGVWVADAMPPRLIQFDSVGSHIRTIESQGAASASSLTVAGSRVLIGQRRFISPAIGQSTRVVFVQGTNVQTRTEFTADSADAARLQSEPFYGAPMVEALVAGQPNGAFVVTYPITYRLRWFDASGSLVREVQGCQGGHDNEKSLSQSSMRQGMSYRIFASALPTFADGRLIHLTTTPDSGFHRLDIYGVDGTLKSSARIPSRSEGGVFVSALFPTGHPVRFWAYNHIEDSIFLVEFASDPAKTRTKRADQP